MVQRLISRRKHPISWGHDSWLDMVLASCGTRHGPRDIDFDSTIGNVRVRGLVRTKTTPQSAAGAAKARKGSEKKSEDDPDGSSVLVISGPGNIPWARETMVALDEA